MRSGVRNRLSVYHEQTEPLVGFYRELAQRAPETAPKYSKVEGVGSMDEIREKVIEALS